MSIGTPGVPQKTGTPPPVRDLATARGIPRGGVSACGGGVFLYHTYRTFALKRPLRLTWPLLYRQFGVNPARATDQVTVDNFRRDCLRELKKIKHSWPDLHYRTVKGRAAALAVAAGDRAVITAPRGRRVSYSHPVSENSPKKPALLRRQPGRSRAARRRRVGRSRLPRSSVQLERQLQRAGAGICYGANDLRGSR